MNAPAANSSGPTILNLGSLNIDRVVRVGHIVVGGETIVGQSTHEFAGGKGANQSVALARAGQRVIHLGKVGRDGQWLVDKLAAQGVDTRYVSVGASLTGQAFIQVDDAGQNAIVLWGGANREITAADVDEALAEVESPGWLLVQNETSAVDAAMRAARTRGWRVAFNPAPFDERVASYPLDMIDLLCVNEIEGAAMTAQSTAEPERVVDRLALQLPNCEILLTLGAQGTMVRGPSGVLRAPALRVEARDTTAAGDTFLGYYLASRNRGLDARQSLDLATRAAALCVKRVGAMDSIPWLDEVLALA